MAMLEKTAMVLAAVGAINWGLVAFVGWNAVDKLLGGIPMAAKIVYALVAVAGIYVLYDTFK